MLVLLMAIAFIKTIIKIAFHLFMIAITGGFWMIVKYRKHKKEVGGVVIW